MDTIINWFRGLSRNTQISIIIALAVFTPVVSVVFSIVFGGIGAIFTVLGFVLGYVNWGIATLLLLGYGGFAFYRWINSEDESEEEQADSWDPFR